MPAPFKLPVLKIMARSLGLLWSSKLFLLGLVLWSVLLASLNERIPATLSCDAVFGANWFYELVLAGHRTDSTRWQLLTSELVLVFCETLTRLPKLLGDGLIFALFAVPWYRRILLDGQKQSLWAIFGWNRQKTVFAAYLLLAGGIIYCVHHGVAAVFAAGPIVCPESCLTASAPSRYAALALNYALMLIPPFAVWILVLRCALIFPAIAIGETGRLRWSWRWTKGQTWRLIALLLLCWFLFAFLAFGLARLPYAIGEELFVEPLRMVSTAVEFIALAVFTAALAISYRTIREHLLTAALAAKRARDGGPVELRLGGSD